MKKLIIIFTYKFPFEPPTEQFLLDEVITFDKFDWDVIIVPTARIIDINNKYNQINIRYIRLNRLNKFIEFFIGLKCIFDKYFWLDIIKLIKTKIDKSFVYKLKEIIYQYFQIHIRVSLFANIKNSFCFEKYDKIVLYSYWFGPMTVSACRIANINNIIDKTVIISRAHGDGDLYLKNEVGNFRPCVDELLKYKVNIFTISNCGKSLLNSQGFQSVIVSRLGVINKNVNNLNTINKNNFLIVSCSTINSNKRVIDIAKSIFAINSFNIDWVHFGGGDKFIELNKWCIDNNKKNINYKLFGYLKHDEIMNYYNENNPDLFINLSLVEGIPVSIMEAFSFGIPCIATDVGATSEIVNNKNGFLIDKNFDHLSVAKIIESYKNLTEDEKMNYRKNALITWRELYNSEENFKEFVGKINSLIINFN